MQAGIVPALANRPDHFEIPTPVGVHDCPRRIAAGEVPYPSAAIGDPRRKTEADRAGVEPDATADNSAELPWSFPPGIGCGYRAAVDPVTTTSTEQSVTLPRLTPTKPSSVYRDITMPVAEQLAIWP